MAYIKYTDIQEISKTLGNAEKKLAEKEQEKLDFYNSKIKTISFLGFSFKINTIGSYDDIGFSFSIAHIEQDIEKLQTFLNMLNKFKEINLNDEEFKLINRYSEA
jgi:hypothetical protein